MSARTRWLILALALVGFGLSVASSYVHYRVLTDPTYISPCDINTQFSCTHVYMSRYGTIGGVPVAVGGLIWFGLVALVAGFAKPDEQASPAGAYLFALATVGLAVILYLGYASFFVLGTGCLLCIGTYACVLGIFALAASASSMSMTRLPLRLLGDIRDGLSRPVVLIAAILYLAGAGSAVAFFPREGSRAAQIAAAPPPTADVQADFKTKWLAQPRVDLGIPADGAKVIIVKFNDYECPPCRDGEQFYQPILQKFERSNPGAIKYVMKDWPWNKSCNFNTAQTFQGHEGSCAAAAAARMAQDKGKFEEMKSWLFANQGVTPEAVAKAAGNILGVTDFDRQYAQKVADIRRDVADGGVLNISATPTYFVNGVRMPDRGLPPQLIELAISIELTK